VEKPSWLKHGNINCVFVSFASSGKVGENIFLDNWDHKTVGLICQFLIKEWKEKEIRNVTRTEPEPSEKPAIKLTRRIKQLCVYSICYSSERV
jgi:hypothetical protein